MGGWQGVGMLPDGRGEGVVGMLSDGGGIGMLPEGSSLFNLTLLSTAKENFLNRDVVCYGSFFCFLFSGEQSQIIGES